MKCLGRTDEFRDVGAELLKGRDFTTADFIPMPLMDSEQLDQEQHRVIFSQPMFIAPRGDGLGEFLVEVRLFCVWLGLHFEGSSKWAAVSTSA